MSLRQFKDCKHLRCYDCGEVESVGYWLDEDGERWSREAQNAGQKPVWMDETMKAAAKRHVKEQHGYTLAGESEKSLDEHVAELCYVSQCIVWDVIK